MSHGGNNYGDDEYDGGGGGYGGNGKRRGKSGGGGDHKSGWWTLGLRPLLRDGGYVATSLEEPFGLPRIWRWVFVASWAGAFICWLPLIAIIANYFNATRVVKMERFGSTAYCGWSLLGVVAKSLVGVWLVAMTFVTLTKAPRSKWGKYVLPAFCVIDFSIAAVFAYVMAYYMRYFAFIPCDHLDERNYDTDGFQQGDLTFYSYGTSSKAGCKAVRAVRNLCVPETVAWIILGFCYVWLIFRWFNKFADKHKSGSNRTGYADEMR